ncbi:MAG: penicillin-binding protein 2 [Patescibacteria group bacterium]|nr:penicillin-binding protein 2 [Patescibacteria group bacterium]MBU1870501.1 penicillin-binding protein 2 [Patescibacteria group bacterium]
MRLKKQKIKLEDPFSIQEGKNKYGYLKSSCHADWTQQIFSFTDSGKETIGKNFNFFYLSKINLVLLFFLLILLIRVAWLQIVKGDYYYDLAEGNRIRIERIEPKRGIIYDKNNQPMVKNIANFLLYFIPADLPKDAQEKKKIIERISQILKTLSPADIENILVKIKPKSLESYQPLFITDNIEYEKAMLLYLESAKMPGVYLFDKPRREYNLYSLSLSHILGYIGKISETELTKAGSEYLLIDYIGKTGIEKFWENELKGVNGKKQIEVDALGKEKKIINQIKSDDGHNLVLSLDIRLQKKLEEVVNKELKKLKLDKACAIIMDPNNGEILAMASFPSYNNNAFVGGIRKEEYEKLINHPSRPLFNRCISGEYSSGSTIKPIVAVAALAEGVINENTSFLSTGGLKIDKWSFPDWKAGGHGVTNVRKALAESVNTFFYYIGGGYNDFVGLGIDRMVKYEKLFGLGEQTGIDIIGEANGFLPTKEWKEATKNERWYIGDTYHVSIGQGDISVTPLQVANYTAVFANSGSLYQPHFVRQVLTANNVLVGQIENKPIRSNFIEKRNIKIVREGMRQAVTAGSARNLQSVPVEVAGKTGTAQWSSNKPAHAWFTGFAPYNNPKVVITILIEQGSEGSSVAVPIANEVLTWYFENVK